jgi:gliding motility-associated lipoprotein GldH
MRKSIYIQLIMLGFVLMSLPGCHSRNFFEQNQAIVKEEWFASDIKEYKIDVNDTNSYFNFYLNVRNNNNYPFANLYVFLETRFPDSTKARDTLELQLADVTGKWLGKGTSRYKYNSFILRKAMRFVKPGEYKFRLEQGMRRDTLEGISEVGIKLDFYP